MYFYTVNAHLCRQLQPNLSSIYFLLLVWEEAAKQWPWAVTRVPGQPCLWWGPCTDASWWWDTAAPCQTTRSCPTQAGPCCTFPQCVCCKISMLLLQREMSDSPNWVWLACKFHHHPCVYGVGGMTLQLHWLQKDIHLPVGPLGSTFPSALHVILKNIWLPSFFEASQSSYVSTKPEQQTIDRTTVSQYFD